MADYDQENVELFKDVLKTKDGIARLALYHSSVGRFSNALGALIYPIYGQGELPQAFCRRAAVKGCLYVLGKPVIALLMDKDNGHYKGVKLASGQDLFSNQLVLDPSVTVSLPLGSSYPDPLHKSLQVFSLRDVKGKVARGICITRSSLKLDTLNFLVVYPPRSLYPKQLTSIRALQICGSLAVCPPGMFVLYLSALCDDDDQGKMLLHAAMNALLTLPVSGNPESSSANQSESTEVKPTLLWSALYIQEMTMIFKEMYPDEEFFPETTSPENPEDDGGLSLET